MFYSVTRPSRNSWDSRYPLLDIVTIKQFWHHRIDLRNLIQVVLLLWLIGAYQKNNKWSVLAGSGGINQRCLVSCYRCRRWTCRRKYHDASYPPLFITGSYFHASEPRVDAERIIYQREDLDLMENVSYLGIAAILPALIRSTWRGYCSPTLKQESFFFFSL